MYIDEWFAEGFYQELPLGYHTAFRFGQIFWTHAYYPHENLQLWRPVPEANEPTRTIASKFQIEPAGRDSFKRTIPLHAPKLETNEEFLVIRAKFRPVILIQPELPIPSRENRGYRGRIHRNRCTVAQVFGLANPQTGAADFSQAFVERIRKLEYPQLLFLPKKAGVLEVDSMLRLDELQSVFTPHLDPTRYCLSADVISLLRDQLQFLFTEKGPSSYTLLREELLRT